MNSSEESEWSGPDMFEVEITGSRGLYENSFNETNNNKTLSYPGTKIVVRPEEALIVIFVLILWVGAIGLFFHRWGKIRNCEPYAPKFEAEDHRGSCHDQSNLINKRMSMSSKLAQPGPTMQLSGNPNSFSKGFVSVDIDCQ
ncbi:CLUMA_CG010020, isoform A [Clunio marinus]|uniref:CLUMA_CG010020, isoform A n=1 Tax=Clunio marinus TaxID=568069 RepID=A0A1J1I8H4_9DIPT|nr:CLUMA_CG010020, isoform A [Clunio marinus]